MKNKNDANKQSTKNGKSSKVSEGDEIVQLNIKPDNSDDKNSIVDALTQEKQGVIESDTKEQEATVVDEAPQPNAVKSASTSKKEPMVSSQTPVAQRAEDTATVSNPQHNEQIQVEKNPVSKLALLCLILILIEVGFGGWGGYMLNAQLEKEQVKINIISTAHQDDGAATQQIINDQSAQLLQVKQQLSQSLEAQQQTITVLQQKMIELAGRRPSDWLIAEANYLVKLAGRKLWQEKNVATASALLTNADMRIAEMNDPSLIDIRQALAADIASLQALPRDNSEDLALKIDGLISQVDQLKLNMVELPDAIEEGLDDKLSDSTADWKENLKRMWHSFSDGFITVRRRAGSVEPLMSPKQQWYLEENLKSKLMQTQLAVYRQQQDAFEHSLELSTRWIMQFFDRQDSTTQFMLKELAELKSEKINIVYPKQLKSGQLIEDALLQRNIGYNNKAGR